MQAHLKKPKIAPPRKKHSQRVAQSHRASESKAKAMQKQRRSKAAHIPFILNHMQLFKNNSELMQALFEKAKNCTPAKAINHFLKKQISIHKKLQEPREFPELLVWKLS